MIHDIVLRIEQERKAQGISLKQFQYLVGISNVGYWEHRAGIGNPRPETLQRMLDTLGLEVTVTVQPKRPPEDRNH